jgi:hypothetical protein
MKNIRITIEFPAPATYPDTGGVLDDVNFEFREMGFLEDWTPENNEGVEVSVEDIPDRNLTESKQLKIDRLADMHSAAMIYVETESELLKIAIENMQYRHQQNGGDHDDDDTGRRLELLAEAVGVLGVRAA